MHFFVTEKYFEMKKGHCKDALDLYRKFLTRMNKVSELLKVAEQVGIDKGDIPDLTKVMEGLFYWLWYSKYMALGPKYFQLWPRLIVVPTLRRHTIFYYSFFFKCILKGINSIDIYPVPFHVKWATCGH